MTGGPNSIEGYDFGLPSKAENFPIKVNKVQQQLTSSLSLTPEQVVETLGEKSLAMVVIKVLPILN